MGIFNEFFKKEKPVFTGSRFGFGSGGSAGIPNGPFSASGGNVDDTSNFPGYIVSVFTSSGSYTIEGSGTATVRYLAVGGGGGGINGTEGSCGGGGAGAYIDATAQISAGTYPIVIGGGGSATNNASPGGTTRINFPTTIRADGGGRGGAAAAAPPSPVASPGHDSPGNGSGGGGGWIYGSSPAGGGQPPSGQGGAGGEYGNPGGQGTYFQDPHVGGGGGGAGSPGLPGASNNGKGGDGLGTYPFVPPSYGDPQPDGRYFAGGGHGVNRNGPEAPDSKGGAPSYQGHGGNSNADPGGSGIVIISVAIDQ